MYDIPNALMNAAALGEPSSDAGLAVPLQGDTGPAKLVLVQDALAQLPTAPHAAGGLVPDGTDPQPQEVFLPDHDFQVSACGTALHLTSKSQRESSKC